MLYSGESVLGDGSGSGSCGSKSPKHKLKRRVVKHLVPNPHVLPLVAAGEKHGKNGPRVDTAKDPQQYHPSLKAIKYGSEAKSRMNPDQKDLNKRMSDPW
jgi:hypothetical protein